MDKWVSFIVIWSLVGCISGQYEQGNRGYQPNGQYNQPSANILLHKQALGQDGSFNYAFAADNGLQQGEVINPDGSRKGSYSYVDPNGKTVSLSYTAGKDGFRVLDGDHVPKPPPQQQQQQPNPYYLQQQQQQLQLQLQRQNPQYFGPTPQQSPYYQSYRGQGIPYEAYKNAPNAPAYRANGNPYQGHLPQQIQTPSLYKVGPLPYEVPYRPAPQKVPHHYQPRHYRVQEGNYDKPSPYVGGQQHQGSQRQEEQQKPHSFGNGFAFEFAGK